MIMRLLNRSKQPGPRILAQAVDGPFLPGDQVDVELICTDEPGEKGGGAEEVFLDLVCRETFWYTVKSTGAAFIGQYPGHGEENHTGMSYTAAGRPGRFKTSKDLACMSSLVPPVSHDLDRGYLRGTARFQLPADAAPSIQGETANVDWELRLRVSSIPSQESTTVGHITVLSSPVGTTGDQERRHESGHRPAAISESITAQCDVSLALAQDVVRTGQTLHGVLKARAITDINVTKVQVELECLEQAGAKESSAIYAAADLQGRSSLQSGKVYQWPFQLQIPNRILPSAKLDETWVVWRVKGILGRTFRARLETATQVQVLT